MDILSITHIRIAKYSCGCVTTIMLDSVCKRMRPGVSEPANGSGSPAVHFTASSADAQMSDVSCVPEGIAGRRIEFSSTAANKRLTGKA